MCENCKKLELENAKLKEIMRLNGIKTTITHADIRYMYKRLKEIADLFDFLKS